jgi:hypothetical protein
MTDSPRARRVPLVLPRRAGGQGRLRRGARHGGPRGYLATGGRAIQAPLSLLCMVGKRRNHTEKVLRLVCFVWTINTEIYQAAPE